MPRIVLEIHEGQIVRNLLENGLLNLLRAGQAQVALVTPAARVASFVSRYGGPGIEFHDLGLLDGSGLSAWENYEFALGQRLSQRNYHGLRRFLWRWLTEPLVARRAKREFAFLQEYQPDVVVSTHISQVYGRRLVAAANRMGIPTIGNLNSWDNAWKGLKVCPALLTCWSETNKAELCNLASSRPEQVQVIGAPAFDAYFALDAHWTRAELCARLGLDANRPLLLFATLGQFKQQIDETNPLEALLKAIDAGAIPGNPQVVVRLHPWSRETYFKPLLQRAGVTVSRYEHYIPGLTWTPTRDEAILAGNLMRHADVVISPGSSMVVEAAIFDTPVVVPVFNEYMPEVFENYFHQTWLNQHFGRIYQNDWACVVKQPEQMISAINTALASPDWYQDGRCQIRENILGPLDGKATERFVSAVFALKVGLV
jgi:UDP-N-acetylglucosamine:LPS N-acetylglucosamine transferase